MRNILTSPPKAFEGNFLLFIDAAKLLQISMHANQLVKRKAKYPAHFKVINGWLYVSIALVQALQQYYSSVQVLTNLKTQPPCHK